MLQVRRQNRCVRIQGALIQHQMLTHVIVVTKACTLVERCRCPWVTTQICPCQSSCRDVHSTSPALSAIGPGGGPSSPATATPCGRQIKPCRPPERASPQRRPGTRRVHSPRCRFAMSRPGRFAIGNATSTGSRTIGTWLRLREARSPSTPRAAPLSTVPGGAKKRGLKQTRPPAATKGVSDHRPIR